MSALYVVEMTPYRCANGAMAGPVRVWTTSEENAVRVALNMWATVRAVRSVRLDPRFT